MLIFSHSFFFYFLFFYSCYVYYYGILLDLNSDEWNNFTERKPPPPEDTQNEDTQNNHMHYVREWVSYRGQTLSRTGVQLISKSTILLTKRLFVYYFILMYAAIFSERNDVLQAGSRVTRLLRCGTESGLVISSIALSKFAFSSVLLESTSSTISNLDLNHLLLQINQEGMDHFHQKRCTIPTWVLLDVHKLLQT